MLGRERLFGQGLQLGQAAHVHRGFGGDVQVRTLHANTLLQVMVDFGHRHLPEYQGDELGDVPASIGSLEYRIKIKLIKYYVKDEDIFFDRSNPVFQAPRLPK